MPRMTTPIRAFAEGEIYHVYNRGNRKQEIFREERNYVRFLERATMYAAAEHIAVLAYCLIPNHYHFLVQQQGDQPVSRLSLRLQVSYARYINLKYHETGHLFERRFQARRVTSDAYLLHLTRYIHLNPFQHLRAVRAAVRRARAYPWSSCAAYLGERDDPAIDLKVVRAYVPNDVLGKRYERFLVGGPWPPPDPEPDEREEHPRTRVSGRRSPPL